MVTTDVELEITHQLKEAGKQLSQPPDSVDELLHLLDQTEKLLTLVDQSPNNLMQEALGPSMKALVDKSLLEHSNVDAKVAVASCICEITRITAPDAPYSDEEMKGVFQCIVSSFENLSDESSRSYGKRASILETVSKVRSCVIMLDLECDDLIVKMFEFFLKSVRDHHVDKNMFSLMVNIMALVLEESEDISVEMLKPLLASIKNNSEGVLPVARKLGEEVLKKSVDKLKPYLTKTLSILGGSLDDYSQVLTSICKGTTDVVEHNDESPSVQPQADDSKLTMTSTEEAAQVVIADAEGPAKTLNLVTGNGTTVTEDEGGSADKESLKKPDEAIDHPDTNLTDDSVAEKLENLAEKSENLESKPEQTSENKSEKNTDIAVPVEKETESDVVNAQQEEIEAANAGSQSESKKSVPFKSRIKKGVRSKKKSSSQHQKTPITKMEDKPLSTISASEDDKATSDSDAKHLKTSSKKVDTVDSVRRPRKKTDSGEKTQIAKIKDKPSSTIATSEDDKATSGSDAKHLKVNTVDSGSKVGKRPRKKKNAGEKTPIAKMEDKPSSTMATSEDDKTTSDSDAKHLNTSSKKVDAVDSGSKPAKRSRKKTDAGEKTPIAKMEDKPSSTIATSEDDKTTGDSDAKHLKTSIKKLVIVDSKSNPAKRPRKKTSAGESKSKRSKQTGKKVDAGDSDGKASKQSLKKDNESDSDDKPPKQSGKKKEKSRVISTENKEGSDSDTKPLKLSAKKGKKGGSSVVKSSSKNKSGKKPTNVEDDGMDVPLKSALKTAKEEGTLVVAVSTNSKRKRSVGKTKVKETIKYDDSLVGQKVKVWWPEDKMYYEGVIESFDSAENKHKVSYLDGDEEILNLKEEKWEVLQEFSVRIEEIAAEGQNTDALPETPKQKKSKPSDSQEKTKDSTKRAGGASVSGKSKGSASKSANDNKSMDNDLKDVSDKSVKEVNSKDGEKSKEADEEMTENKQEPPQKIVYVSKRKKALESGNKVNANEEPKSKDEDGAETPAESPSAEGKSAETAATKSGSKRRKKMT